MPPNIDRRVYRSHEVLVIAGGKKMIVKDQRTMERKIITYRQEWTLRRN